MRITLDERPFSRQLPEQTVVRGGRIIEQLFNDDVVFCAPAARVTTVDVPPDDQPLQVHIDRLVTQHDGRFPGAIHLAALMRTSARYERVVLAIRKVHLINDQPVVLGWRYSKEHNRQMIFTAYGTDIVYTKHLPSLLIFG